MKYKILKVDNPNCRPSSHRIYEAHIAVLNGVLEKNHTPFTEQQLFYITNGWRNMELIEVSDPNIDYTPKLSVSKYLLIKRLK
jgi:hypothetical protein